VALALIRHTEAEPAPFERYDAVGATHPSEFWD
jgi:hypothetical protein